ncbi:MAG: NADH-quinone oxidoreductase subunit L, partial [Dehalococcoidia bacterium]
DIKRVLAYSTISQLGYMMAALGIGAYDLAVFHLFNHAFFKALLFLGAGSVSHATGTFDMRYMGGLRRVMPITYTTMVIGGLSLAGLFPLAGFWSKDEIVAHALGGGSAVDGIVFVLLMVGIFVTAFYMFRLIFLTFHGQFRGGMEAEVREQPGLAVHGEPRVHLAESLPVMTVPLMLLAVPSVLSGYLVNPLGLGSFLAVPGRWFQGFLEVSASAPVYPLVLPFDVGLAVWSTLLALGGIALAGVMYLARPRALEGLRGPLRLAYTGLTNKYYMDSLYERILVSRLFYRGLCAATDWFDRTLVDGTVDTVGWFGRNLGRGVARLQTGQVQAYAVGIFLGILVILAAYLIWG